MFWGLYLALFAFASACTLIALVARRSVIPLGLAAAGTWSVLTLQARNIVVYHQDGTSTVVGSVAWQRLALGLALLSLGATILYWWGVFPPEDPAATDETAHQDGHVTHHD